MNIQAIGGAALDALRRARSAEVYGISRRGIFLRLDCGWMVFLTASGWHGPLTINLSRAAHLDGKIYARQRVSVSSGLISFEAGPVLEIEPALVWQAPHRPAVMMAPHQRRQALWEMVRAAEGMRPAASLAALRALAEDAQPVLEGEAYYLYPPLLAIQTWRATPAERHDPSALSAVLGLGKGLTPSGDDIVLGFLLSLHRWGDVLAPGMDYLELNQAVLARANQKTTTLAANLLACAGHGQADERLLAALDGLMSGNLSPWESASRLAEWGNFSGFDALCGMALAAGI